MYVYIYFIIMLVNFPFPPYRNALVARADDAGAGVLH